MDSNIIYIIESPDTDLSIKKLILSHNKLTTMSEEMLQNFVKLEYIDVSYNYITSFDEAAFIEPKRLIFIDFSYNDLKYISLNVIGALEVLNLEGNNLAHFELTNASFGETLRELRIQNNKLREFHAVNLGSLEVCNYLTEITTEITTKKNKITTEMTIDKINEIFISNCYNRP